MEIEGVALGKSPRYGGSKKSTETISILVVDDDTACLAIVAATLKKFKYEVVTVKHANDALCTLRIKGGAFDLVVSDVHMPDMNGFELQQAIAQEFNNLPVILMSADPKEGVALKGLENGAAFFIYKPVCPDDVRDLWQFAAMKKQSQVTIHEEEIKNIGDETIISVSSSSMNEDRDSKKDKSPINEGFDAKKGETCQASSASQKKPKMIWTNSLHNRFLEAIRSLGLDRAVPKKILQVMNVPGLTRENVASHLQKYRIFLRRVSDASYKVQYSADRNNLSSTAKNLFMTPSTALGSSSSSSALTLNRFPYHKPGGQYFPAAAGLLGQSRVMLPNIGSQSAGGRPSINLSPSSFSSPLMGPTTMNTSTYNNSSIPSNIITPSNYVGYSVSNLSSLTGTLGECFRGNSTLVEQTNAGGYTNIPQAFDNYFAVGNNNNNGAGDQLSNAIGDYQLMPLSLNQPLHCGNVGNGGGLNREPAYSSMLDMFDLDLGTFATPQPLDQGEFHTTFSNQANFLNQAQQNAGETFTTSNFYGDTSRWNHNSFPSFVPAPNQQQQYFSQNVVKPQELVVADSSAQLNNTTLLPPNDQHDDDDFLESLLAPYGEDQTLEGI